MSFQLWSRKLSLLVAPTPLDDRGRWRRRVALGVFIIAVLSGAVQADDSDGEREADFPRLSLKRALEHARSSASATQSLLNLREAEGRLDEFRGQESWILNATLESRASVSPPEQPVEYQTNVSLEKRFSTGGQLTMTATSTHQTATLETPPAENTVTEIVARQPLLRGAGWDGISDRKIAEYTLRERRKAQQSDLNELLRRVKVAYWQVAYAYRELEHRRNSMTMTKEQLRVVLTRQKAGRASTVDVDLVRQDIARQKELLLQARAAFSLQCAELRRLAGMPSPTARVEFRPSTPLKAANTPYERESVAVTALEDNPLLALRQAEFDTAKKNAEFTESRRRPQLDLQLSARSSISPDTDNQSWQARLVFQQELTGRRRRGLRKQAETLRRRARIQMAITREQILADVARSSAAYDASRLRIKAASRAVEQAQRVVKSEQALYRAGRATSFDILQRIQALRQAELARARALVDHRVALAELEALTGKLVAGDVDEQD